MDEAESKAAGDASTVQCDVTDLRAEAEEELRRMKAIGFWDLFSFDKLIFPKIARFLFLLYCALMALALVVCVFASFAAMVSQGFFAGLATLVAVLVSFVLVFIGTRVWFEIVIVAFKLYESVTDIRHMLQKKM